MRRILIYILFLVIFPCTSFGDVTKGLVGWWQFDTNTTSFPTPGSGDFLVGSVSDNNFGSTTLTPNNGWSTAVNDAGGGHGWHDMLVDKVSGASLPYTNTGTFSPTTNFDIGAAVVAFKTTGSVTRVQATSNNATGTSVTVPITATTAGNLLVLYVAFQNSIQSVTDNKGDSYSFVSGAFYYSNYAWSYFYYVANVPAGVTSVTVSESGSDVYKAFVAEYSGVATSNPLDGAAGFDNAAGGTYTSGNAVSPAANTTSDSSGNSNTGTLANMTSANVVAGKMSQALSFNGSSQDVNVGTLGTWGSTTSSGFTMSAWVNTTYTSNYIAILGAQDNGTDLNVSIYLNYAAGGVHAGYVETVYGNVSGNLYQNYDTNSTTGITDGKWHLVTWTTNPCAQTGTLYIDAKSVPTTEIRGSAICTASNLTTAMGIGFRVGANDGYWNGDIDDARIYSRVLTAAEVWDIYQGGDSMKFGPD